MVAGQGDAFVVGGTESMSNIPLLFSTAAADKFAALARAKSFPKKLGAMLAFRPGDFKPRIAVMMGLTDPVCGLNMGQTAEVLYRDYGIPRARQDAFALESHQKTVKARAKLAEEICTVYLPNGKYVDKDNGVRENQTMEALAKLRPVFDKRNGTVTAGNSSPGHRRRRGAAGHGGREGASAGFHATRLFAGVHLRRGGPETHGVGPGVRDPESVGRIAGALERSATDRDQRGVCGAGTGGGVGVAQGIRHGNQPRPAQCQRWSDRARTPGRSERGAAGADLVEGNEASQPEDGHCVRLRGRGAGRRADFGAGMMQSPRVEYDAEGIAWVVFNDPESKVNVLGTEQMQQLDAILDELYKRKPKAVVFISARPDIFMAGADIKELQRIHDASLGADLSRAGHRIFAKIERIGVPTVAAIDGACLGGGCELALACRYRVAADGPKTQIGLPETQLGIIPGWGGSQRLPRLIGLGAALDIICAGKSITGQGAAHRSGGCRGAERGVARDGDAAGAGRQRVKRKSVWIQNWWPMRRLICRVARKRVLLRTEGRYPAPLRAIDAMEEGLSGSLTKGWRARRRFLAK